MSHSNITKFCFILYLIFLGTSFFSDFASTTSCPAYPSEYAYRDDSVTRAEGASANCRRYPRRDSDRSIVYIHCDGNQLKLSDSNRGSNTEYTATSYYVWTADNGQLLFTFPEIVSFIATTLHYYSDSDQGLPRLRFYAVPDNFDVWNVLTSGNPYAGVASVPPGGEPAGRRSVSFNINFNTNKVLMYKFSSSFRFAVSEVEFFANMTDCPSPSAQPETDNYRTNENSTTEKHAMSYAHFATTHSSSASTRIITSAVTDSMTLVVQSNIKVNIVAIGVSIAMLLILSTAIIITATVLIWSYKRRSSKQANNCSPYSTLNRRAGQPQPLQQDSAELYDQIHLSPSTGQTEYIPNETANESRISKNCPLTYSTADEADIAEHSSALNTAKAITSQLSSQSAHESTSEQPTYAAVDTSKKKKPKKKEDVKCKEAEKGPPVAPYAGHDVKENIIEQEINSPHTIEQLYTAVEKKQKIGEPKGEQETPPIPPPHTVEELYTAVQKKPRKRSSADSNKDEALPPHTVEEMHTAGEKPSQIPQNATEDLYTAVMKKPKDSSRDDTETAPPIPPHTVEEMYTAVMKVPKSGAEDEEEAPPIPLYTVKEN